MTEVGGTDRAPIVQPRVLMVVAERGTSGRIAQAEEELPSWLSDARTHASSDAAPVVSVVHFSATPQVTPQVTTNAAASLPCLRTWELVDRLDRVEVVHVCRPATPAGELAVLAAKVLKKRLVVSDLAVRDSTLGVSVGVLDLADVLICDSALEAELYGRHPGIRVLDGDDPVLELHSIYADLYRTTRVEAGRKDG